MNYMTRRVAIVGAMAAATVAVAITARKSEEVAPPSRTFVLRPADEAPEPLRPLADAMRPIAPPKPMPALRFTAADGSARTLGNFAGKGVILNFWATWCAPCKAELPSLDALARELAGDNVVVVALSSDRGGAAAVRDYYRAHGIAHLGVWLDPDAAALHAITAPGIPVTLILDRQGRERARVEGSADWAGAGAAAAIRKLMG